MISNLFKKENLRIIVSLLLKIIVFSFATIGTLLCIFSNRDSFMGGASVLMYFTIQSNIFIAIICLIGGILLIFSKNIKNSWYIVKYVATVSITLTGFVFCFVLAPTMGKNAFSVVNVFTHVIVPISAIIDFFVTGVYSNIGKKNIIYIIIPPLLYVIFAGVGYVLNWQFSKGANYPYFFLNWGSSAGAFGFSNQLPFMGTVYWILVLLAFIILVGYLYLLVLEKLKKNFQTK